MRENSGTAWGIPGAGPTAQGWHERYVASVSFAKRIRKADIKEPRLAYPADKEPLQPGYVYRWEVTDQDFRQVASGEFTIATASELAQLDELKALAGSGDRADVHSAALAYRRLAAYDEAIAANERLGRESPDEPAYRIALADLYRIAGRAAQAEALSNRR